MSHLFDRKKWPDPLWIVTAGLVASIAYPVLAGTGTLPCLPCHFKLLSGIPCAMCGFGGAVILLTQGDPIGAIAINPLGVFFLLAGVAYVIYRGAAHLFFRGAARPQPVLRNRRALLLFTTTFALIVTANWVYVLAP